MEGGCDVGGWDVEYISNGIHVLCWLESHIQLLLHRLYLFQALCSSPRLSVLLSWTSPAPFNAFQCLTLG